MIEANVPASNGTTAPAATPARLVRFVTRTLQAVAFTWRGHQANASPATMAPATLQSSGSRAGCAWLGSCSVFFLTQNKA